MPRRRPSPSPLLEPPVLIILLPIITLIFLFFLIPPFLSLTSQILRPTISVKKSWDSFNVFLVIFAILCGIFAKKNDDGSPADEDHIQDPVNVAGNNTNIPESESVLPQQWFGFSERNKIYDPPPIRTPESNGGDRLRRSSSSYPDLRQQSLWEDEQTRDDKSRFRFFDDFEINKYRSSSSTIDHNHHMRHRHHTKQSGSKECDDVEEIPIDTYQALHSSPPPPKSPAPPPPPPPPPTATRHQKPRRTYQTVGRKEKVVEEVNYENEAAFAAKVQSPPPTPPPPPPPRPAPPPSPIRIRSEHKRRKSNVKREIATVWASVLNNQRKRKKKQKVTTRNIYDGAPHDHSPLEQQEYHYYTRPPPSPPPPPPPPPPPSVFHSLFKKGSKTKKIHSVSPPSPPPPPPMQKHKSLSTRTTMPPPAPPTPPPQPPSASRRRASASGGRPPLPNKANNFYDENVNSGCQSPMIPPSPPPPPFKMPELRFSVRGDFVKIRSAQSSRCVSPELDDVDSLAAEEDASLSSQSKRVNVMDGGDGGGGAGSVFCPSPDVNTKADSFIARLRDEWRLEKMNSLREKKKMGHGAAQKQ